MSSLSKDSGAQPDETPITVHESQSIYDADHNHNIILDTSLPGDSTLPVASGDAAITVNPEASAGQVLNDIPRRPVEGDRSSIPIQQHLVDQLERGRATHKVPNTEEVFTAPDDKYPMIMVRAATFQSRAPSLSSEDSFEDFAFYGRPRPLRRPSPLHRSVTTDHQAEEVLCEIFPETISCFLHLTFDDKGHDLFKNPYVFSGFVWHKLQSYKELKQKSDEVLEQVKRLSPFAKPDHAFEDTRELYLRYGSYFLEGTSADMKHSQDLPIDDEFSLHEVAIRQICGFIRDYPFQKFDLVIRCDYSLIQKTDINPEETDPSEFLGIIQEQYLEKLKVPKTTICKRLYVSRADLKVLTHPQIANKIIDNDLSRDLTKTKKDDLKRAMGLRPAVALQAVCIHNKIGMDYFYHLLLDEPHVSKQFSDGKYPTLKDACDDKLCRRNHQQFVNGRYQFFVHDVSFDRWYHKHDFGDIVPVRRTERPELGSGGFSTVFEVDIDPAHMGHDISTDPTRKYALKEFKTGAGDGTAFEREIRMLLYLAVYPHDHILTHITSWSRNNNYYILYEEAEFNLRQYMEDVDPGEMTCEEIKWFLLQVRGLTDAIRRIHQFRVPQEATFAHMLDRRPGIMPPRRRRGIVGRHHDIKPENILVFSKPDLQPIFKISDFGAGKFTKVKGPIMSGPQASGIRGTPSYNGPECHPQFEFGHKMTRPFDIWALGCVFLELLIWVTKKQDMPDGETRKPFADMRTEQNGSSAMEMDVFWYMDRSRHWHLNGAVQRVMDHLDAEFTKADMRALLDLLELVEAMLAINPDQRIKAADLYNRIDTIVAQAEVDLDHEPNAYKDRFHNLKNPTNLRELKILHPKWAQPQSPSADVSTVTALSRRSSVGDMRGAAVTDVDLRQMRESDFEHTLDSGSLPQTYPGYVEVDAKGLLPIPESTDTYGSAADTKSESKSPAP